MRKKPVMLLIGGLAAAGITMATVQVAGSATPAKGSDPAAAHRANVTKGRTGIDAPQPPRPLGEQLAVDPPADAASDGRGRRSGR